MAESVSRLIRVSPDSLDSDNGKTSMGGIEVGEDQAVLFIYLEKHGGRSECIWRID
jgi:hypothetical protein